MLQLENLSIEWLGHASFKISTKEKIIYIDPYDLKNNFEPADLILITHEHFDHCDANSIKKLLKSDTTVVATKECREELKGIKFREIKPNDSIQEKEIKIETISAYNINKLRSPDVPFHPKGFKVGYIVNIDKKRIYHAGDTDFTPEMKSLKNIDVALVPIGGNYTMTIGEAAEAVNTFKPKIVIPMHYNTFEGIEADPKEFSKMVKASQVKILE